MSKTVNVNDFRQFFKAVVIHQSGHYGFERKAMKGIVFLLIVHAMPHGGGAVFQGFCASHIIW